MSLDSFVTYVLDLYIYAALGMFYAMHAGGKSQKSQFLTVYTSPVSPEALMDLYDSDKTKTICCLCQPQLETRPSGPPCKGPESLNVSE